MKFDIGMTHLDGERITGITRHSSGVYHVTLATTAELKARVKRKAEKCARIAFVAQRTAQRRARRRAQWKAGG